MMVRITYRTLIGICLIAFAATPHLPDQQARAQSQRLTGDFAYGIVGSGDILSPSGRLGYAREIVSHVDVVGETRFSHLQRFGNEDPLSRGNFTYLDVSIGPSIHPLDTENHRIDLGLYGTVRHRWETRAIRARVGSGGELISITYERRTSFDAGYLLRFGYSYRISRKVRLGLHAHGYTYQEGTSVFLVSLTMDYLL
jgi:hypothetical protein